MSHADLLNLRNSLPANDPRQQILAPYEHQAFAREWTQQNPWVATPSLLAAIPLYSLGKAVGLLGSRSSASVDEMADAYRGVGQGLLNYFGDGN
jgi:hypothetical protein